MAQVCALITSPICVITTPGQLSDAETEPVLTGGTAAAQLTVTGAGQVITGACVSFTVTVNVQVTAAQVFVAVMTTVVVPTLKNEPLPFPLPLPVVAPLNEYVITGAGVPVDEVL